MINVQNEQKQPGVASHPKACPVANVQLHEYV